MSMFQENTSQVLDPVQKLLNIQVLKHLEYKYVGFR